MKSFDTDYIFVTFTSIKNNLRYTHTQILEESQHTSNNISGTTFDGTAYIETKEFFRLCKHMSRFSDSIGINCVGDDIKFLCKSRDNGNLLGKQLKNIAEFFSEKKSDIRFVFNLTDLMNFENIAKICSDMQLYLKEDYPLFMKFNVGALGTMTIGISSKNYW